MSKKSPDPNDIVVGQRIQAARHLAGISQTVLANHLGLTFQQIQKYESGANRVSIGRLVKVATLTRQPMSFFTEGMGNDSTEAVNMAFVDAVLGTTQGVRAVRAYAELSMPTQRAVTALLEAMVKGNTP